LAGKIELHRRKAGRLWRASLIQKISG